MFPITYYYVYDDNLQIITKKLTTYENKPIGETIIPDLEKVLQMRQPKINFEIPYINQPHNSYHHMFNTYYEPSKQVIMQQIASNELIGYNALDNKFCRKK